MGRWRVTSLTWRLICASVSKDTTGRCAALRCAIAELAASKASNRRRRGSSYIRHVGGVERLRVVVACEVVFEVRGERAEEVEGRSARGRRLSQSVVALSCGRTSVGASGWCRSF